MKIIEVSNLVKDFKKSIDNDRSFIKSFFNPKYKIERAVNNISFSIDEGEIIGYLGPNGAGKSTTIKMLTGILVPTEGEINVAGIAPHISRKEHAKRIGVVFGQRTQLWWELPVQDSLTLLKHIYKVSESNYKKNIELFQDVLGINEFINTPVRQLSLGQRMRADLAASLLHNPKILFLDEPTIGLDIVVKEKIREFILTINREQKVTILLTTHDVGDIEQLCNRTIVIDHGEIIYDGSLAEMRNKFGKIRTLVVEVSDKDALLGLNNVEIVKFEGSRTWLSFNKEITSPAIIINDLIKKCEIADLSLEEPQIENIIKEIYTNSSKNLYIPGKNHSR